MPPGLGLDIGARARELQLGITLLVRTDRHMFWGPLDGNVDVPRPKWGVI